MFIGSPYIILYWSFVQTLWRQNKNDDKAFSRLPFYCRLCHPPVAAPQTDDVAISNTTQIFNIRYNNNIYIVHIQPR